MKRRTAVSWRAVITATFLASALACHAAFTATYDFTGNSTAATGGQTGVTLSSFGSGNGISASVNNAQFSASGWTTSSSRDLSDYFSFTISAAANYQITVTRVELDSIAPNGNGIANWSIYSSRDSFNSALSTFTANTASDVAVNLSSFVLQPNTSVEFRIYGYGAKNNNSGWSIDNVQLFGDVSAVPEPTHVALGIFGGLIGLGGVWRHRRQRAAVSI